MSAALDAFLAEHPLTESVDLLLPDLSGIARGKRIPAQGLRAALAGETFFTSSAFALDVTGANVEGSGMRWSSSSTFSTGSSTRAAVRRCR
jgi:glutamine synthetase